MADHHATSWLGWGQWTRKRFVLNMLSGDGDTETAVDWVTTQDHRSELNRVKREFFDASVQADCAERLRE